MCNFRPFNAHIQIFSYVFLNFSQQILTFTKIHTHYNAVTLSHSVRSTLSLRAENRGPRGILLYPWGKGVCKHKTGDCRLRQSVGQKRSIRRIARKGNLVIKPKTINAILSAFTNFRTWSTPLFINTSLLKSNKRELIKISIQFVCKLQSIIILYTKVNRSIFSHHILLYLYLLKHTYYIW